MDFENVDLQAVLDEVAESGLSVSQAGDRLTPTEIAEYRDIAKDGVEVVVLDSTSAQGTGLRNLAQSVKDTAHPDSDEGAATVVVRAPHNTQVISDEMSRYQIESNQGELHGSTDPSDLVAFLASTEGADPDFTGLYVIALVGVLLVVAASAVAARLTYRR